MSVKTLDTLVEDIYESLKTGKFSDDAIERLSSRVSTLFKERLSPRNEEARLRFSNLGHPDRKLWYDINSDDRKELSGQDRLKFLYGDLIEALIVWLVEESGHKLEDFQRHVEIDGVEGHMDCSVDGVVLDVKSASPTSFYKFKNGEITSNDPFGYVTQLASYYQSVKGEDITDDGQAGWLVVNKVSGEILLTLCDSLAFPSSSKRIKEARKILDSDTPPSKMCYDPVPRGKGGNMELGFGCRFCEHKKKCWPKMRVFKSSQGPVYLSKVVKNPRMEEITNEV